MKKNYDKKEIRDKLFQCLFFPKQLSPFLLGLILGGRKALKNVTFNYSFHHKSSYLEIKNAGSF